MTALRLLAAALVIHLALVLPSAPIPVAAAATRIAPELPLVLLALTIAGRRGRGPVVMVLSLLVIQTIADLAMIAVLGRPFNLLTDMALIRSGIEVLAGATGLWRLFVTGAAVAAAVLALGVALWWAVGVWSNQRWRPAHRLWLAMAAVLLPGVIWLSQAWPGNGPYLLGRAALLERTAGDLRRIRQAVAEDPLADAQGLLSDIDRDVLVIFVESYGRASFDAPFHAGRHLATLRDAERRMAAAGLAMRSRFLTAPTQGGQSWLSHATFASGLWIADQSSHAAVLASGRQGLFHHAHRSGFMTAAVMPAVTRPWPEAALMGFDRVLAAWDLGYRGLPFNWVTMPDQFTLAAVDRLLRGTDGPPLFVQVALISSHAPWVPVPKLLAWDRVGDGTVFDAMARAGDRPEVVWRDRDRVRAAYREAVDYSLAVVADYALRHADDPPLMIVLGDHQPVPWVAQAGGADVAIHLIGPAYLVDRAAGWGFAPGLIPPAGSPAIPMDRMRDLILRGFEASSRRDEALPDAPFAPHDDPIPAGESP